MRVFLEPHSPSFKWLHYTILLLLALFPVISVSISSGGSVIYTFLVLPALVFGWSGWQQLSTTEKQWAFSLIALFIIASLSLLYSEELRDGTGKLERYFRLMTIPLIYLMVRRLHIEAGRLLLVGVAMASISLAAQAYYQTLQLNQSVAHGLYHKIVFGDMAVLTVAILTAALLTIVQQRWMKLVVTICILSALYAAIASMTRGAWLLIPVYFALIVWLYRYKMSKRQWLTIGLILVVTISLLSIWTPKKIESGIERGYADLAGFIKNPATESSWGARLNMWRNSTIIWSRSPAAGTGIGDFQHDSKQMIHTEESLSRHAAYEHAHSIYFDALATMGLLGLTILILALFILPWKIFMRFWKEADTPWIRFYALSGLLVITSFTFFGLSEGWLSRNPFINPYIIYLIVFLSSIKIHGVVR